jgi:hypothetical protein
MRTSISGSFGAILALAAGSIPLAASAFLITPVIQPPGVNCVAVKIVSLNALSWAVMNCSNGLAYMIRNKNLAPVLLALPAGATSERVYDVARKGWSVGSATFPAAPFTRPVRWNPAGAPVILSNGTATAAGIDQFSQPVVGFRSLGPPMRAFWYSPGAPHFLGAPPPPAGSFAYDVNAAGRAVGQFGGVAAVGLNPVFPTIAAALPGATTSVAYAINETNFVVGHADFPGAGCNGGPPGVGFMWQSPGPPAAAFGPLPGDCTGAAEDDNDAGAVVGYSMTAAGLPQAVGFGLAPPFPPPSPGFANLNAIAGHPWVWLADAPGVDNANSVIATDIGAPLWQVYILN